MIPVIIPAYKNTLQLQKCLTHLKNQTVEVDPFVRDNSDNNIYFTAAVNEGIRKYLSQPGDYIMILNQDMYLEPDAVEKMVAFMDTHPQCGIGCPLQLDSNNPQYVIFAGGFEAFPEGKHQHGPLSEFTFDETIFWSNGACMILRKQMIHEIGLLDENYVFVGSDSDYCFTARSRGWQVWRIAASRGIHEFGVSLFESEIEIERIKICDMLHFGKKWLTGWLFSQLSFEGENQNIKEIEKVMSRLVEAKKELEQIAAV